MTSSKPFLLEGIFCIHCLRRRNLNSLTIWQKEQEYFYHSLKEAKQSYHSVKHGQYTFLNKRTGIIVQSRNNYIIQIKKLNKKDFINHKAYCSVVPENINVRGILKSVLVKNMYQIWIFIE